MRILGLIPARGGSKGIPRKNIKLLEGRPLINYSIEAGLKCALMEKVVVSTEDEEIAQISREAGAEVPFMRPAELAADHSPTIDMVIHALQFFQNQGEIFDAICLLQPTVPFRLGNDLTQAITRFMESGADSLISVRSVPHAYNPHWVYEQNQAGFLHTAISKELRITRRQDLPPAYHRDGSVYLCRSSIVLEDRSLYGQKIIPFVMANSPNINIDTMEDWQAAESFASSNYPNPLLHE